LPHALTDRQRDYLNFIKSYIAHNEEPPRLEEVAEHFYVKPPTAHKTLEALQRKGFLFFDRTSEAGFFIRLIERAGAQEIVLRVPITGKVNQLGEVYDFPEMLGEFPAILAGVKKDDVGALVLTEDIPQADMLANDFIIFDMGKKPQPGDICISIIGERYFLFRILRKTFNERFISFDGAHDYPIPEAVIEYDRKQRLYCQPLAYTEDLHDIFISIYDDQGQSYLPVPENFAFATVLRLMRVLSY
jgi:SOS-response transcriptional repressor LexA